MADYRRGAHTFHDIKLHVVWTTKYRHPILLGEIGLTAREFIRQICQARDVVIVKGSLKPDHVHLMVEIPPGLSVSDLMQAIKGKSARLLFRDFPALRRRYWGQHLWSRGYFAASVGCVDEALILDYIAHQDKPRDEGFTVDGAQGL